MNVLELLVYTEVRRTDRPGNSSPSSAFYHLDRDCTFFETLNIHAEQWRMDELLERFPRITLCSVCARRYN